MYAHENLDVQHDYSTYTVCIVWTGYGCDMNTVWSKSAVYYFDLVVQGNYREKSRLFLLVCIEFCEQFSIFTTVFIVSNDSDIWQHCYCTAGLHGRQSERH